MALRYLARRALQHRALAPRVPPSAGSRPVSTRGSSPREGLLINEPKASAAASKGNKEPELLGMDFTKHTDEQICQKLDKICNMYKAAIEDLNEAARNRVIDNWCIVGSAATGAGLAFLHIAYDMRKEGKITLGAKA